MQYKKILFAIAVISMFALLLVPVYAHEYGDPAIPDNTNYEGFGPRADRLLIKLYASATSEWDTGVETDEIDVTDWPLDADHYNRYINLPWTDPKRVLGYGAEFGLFIFDLNNNNNEYLGNPPNVTYPNPVYPNPMSVVSLRQAIAHLVNRDYYVNDIVGAEAAVALYTPVPPSMGKYSHPEIRPGGAREDLTYPFGTAAAAALLEADGFLIGGDGWRYWDKDGNGVKGAGEDFALKFFARSDDPNRLGASEHLYGLLEADPIKIHVTWAPGDVSAARLQVMSNKDFHIYSGGWSLGVDQEQIIIIKKKIYWHPGRPYNYAGCNDVDFNAYSYGVMYANTQEEAVNYAQLAQEVFAEKVLSIPLWSASGYKVVSRTYLGTPGVPDEEDVYEGKYWRNFVNIPGYGVDSSFSFLNMRPTAVVRGGTIRYGFKTVDLRQLNPLYSEWLWDNTVLDLIGYESLVTRNPYDLGQFKPWLADSFKVGTYEYLGETCSNYTFTLRREAYWADGQPITIDDIIYTFLQIDDDLAARGLAPPWWISNVMDIVNIEVVDEYTFIVYMGVKSIYALGWCGGNRILPKHIWEPIILTGDPTTFAPDSNMIGSGPWRLDEYVPNSHVLLVANKPGSTVDTGISDPNGNSVPITSPYGFFRYYRDEDFNSDDKVNILDAIKLSGAFGTSVGDPGYSRKVDINGDGKVNILDAIKLSVVFGWPNNELAE